MALQAGRVGVAPDQVDIFGKIKTSGEVVTEILSNFPLLGKKWYKIHLTSDGNAYTLESEFSGANAGSGLLTLPAGNKVEAYIIGFETLSQGSAATVNITPKNYVSSGKCCFSIPQSSVTFDVNMGMYCDC